MLGDIFGIYAREDTNAAGDSNERPREIHAVLTYSLIKIRARGRVAESSGFLSPLPLVDNDDSRCGAAAATDTHKHTV